MNKPAKAKRTIVRFCPGIEVEGFEFPDGTYYVSITTASEAIGYNKNWLSRSIGRSGNTFKAITRAGFTNFISEVVTPSDGGEQASKLISIDDFARLILYAASRGKKEAMALNMALTKMSLTDFFRDAFGARPLTIEEKRAAFYKTYVDSLSREDWLEMDRKEDRIILGSYLFLTGE
ncbi:MAG: hypothetical protein F6K40_12380 [Okeania sp. SIO3I5]|uniref:hypothetical protein n=1 Tax=Okeania sp. SIO3I5 TaxID=2607805 RepID=UPI0013BD6F62|nr:hypothetical protein [Okeania sp. SIO3I5]NEQ37027.1 hypothetical protein [Okeania sp. SIO3I5]